jgi:hypothetical protein
LLSAAKGSVSGCRDVPAKARRLAFSGAPKRNAKHPRPNYREEDTLDLGGSWEALNVRSSSLFVTWSCMPVGFLGSTTRSRW